MRRAIAFQLVCVAGKFPTRGLNPWRVVYIYIHIYHEGTNVTFWINILNGTYCLLLSFRKNTIFFLSEYKMVRRCKVLLITVHSFKNRRTFYTRKNHTYLDVQRSSSIPKYFPGLYTSNGRHFLAMNSQLFLVIQILPRFLYFALFSHIHR